MILVAASDKNWFVTIRAEPNGAVAAPELTVSSLTVRFSTVTALTDVNLAVRAGEVVALAGENGAGKTTLIRAVAGDLAPALRLHPGRRARRLPRFPQPPPSWGSGSSGRISR